MENMSVEEVTAPEAPPAATTTEENELLMQQMTAMENTYVALLIKKMLHPSIDNCMQWNREGAV